jgi:Family of unknown function (DUF5895)
MARKTTESAQAPETTVNNADDATTSVNDVNETNDTFVPPDEFASPEFVDPNGKMPRIQALRGEHNLDHCGYFIPLKNVALAGWQNLDESQVITYTFQSGDEEQGLLFKEPRMIVCPKTPLLAWDRKASEEEEQTVLIGEYVRKYRADENISTMQWYLVFLLNQDNTPMHQLPLVYKAKGANQASFSEQWQQLCMEINLCHAITHNLTPKPKNHLFNSLCVFQPQIKRELVGKKKKGHCCYIASHTKPNLDNWRDFFLGYSDFKPKVWEALEPQNLIRPALPAAQ